MPEPGGPPWAQRGTKGGGQTVAVNNRPTVIAEQFNQTTTLSAGSTETVEVYAPTDAVWDVRALKLRADPDSNWTSGSHRFKVSPAGSNIASLNGKSNYDRRVEFNFSEWSAAGVNARPSGAAAQQSAVQSMLADPNQPIVVQYYNDADGDQTNTRNITVVSEEVTY